MLFVQGGQGQAIDSKPQVVSAMELPVATTTPTMNNPVFQQEADVVRDMEVLQ